MRRLGHLAAALLCGVAIAGCGGGDESADTADPPAGMDELQSCLAEQGVEMPEMPEPPTAPSGSDAPDLPEMPDGMDEALAACAEYAPSEGVIPGGAPPGAGATPPPGQWGETSRGDS